MFSRSLDFLAGSKAEPQPPRFRVMLDSNIELWSKFADYMTAIQQLHYLSLEKSFFRGSQIAASRVAALMDMKTDMHMRFSKM